MSLALLAAIAAGVFGAGVADGLNPYGAEDPATDSIRAIERLEGATGLDPAIGLVALVETAGGPARPALAGAGRSYRR